MLMGKVDVAILKRCENHLRRQSIPDSCRRYRPTIARLADKVIIELNAAHSKNGMGLHDL